MPINQLTNFCHLSITKNGKCLGCEHDCINSCNHCLQQIHHGYPRNYDCPNMIYCYTCSYIYKYASEIGHLLNLVQFNWYNEFNVLSLGCGSCADLFGIDNFLRNQQRNIPINYHGIDLNERWTLTHQRIVDLFPLFNINFSIMNVIDYLAHLPDDEPINSNIIILQYVLNEIYKYEYERLDEFETLFVNKIVNNLAVNSSIVINDINLNTARGIATRILRKVLQSNVVEFREYRFYNPTSHTYGGAMYQNDQILFNIPQLIHMNYDVKGPCSGYQMYIIKTGNR
jgi:hypothetical protein